MLYCDEICCPCQLGVQSVHPGTPLYDCGFQLSTGLSASAARTYVESGRAERWETPGQSFIRAMLAEGADGRRYLLLANLSAEPAEVPVPGPCVDVATGERLTASAAIQPGAARLCRQE